ncbi:MAG: hypothetical protein RMJ16_09210, partial [Thermoguttaceae bacterium]|nr:hypothetical protein [Thermoguttaceae bacterium]
YFDGLTYRCADPLAIYRALVDHPAGRSGCTTYRPTRRRAAPWSGVWRHAPEGITGTDRCQTLKGPVADGSGPTIAAPFWHKPCGTFKNNPAAGRTFVSRPRSSTTSTSKPPGAILQLWRYFGASPWPNLFHGRRKSRETDLGQSNPLPAVTRWLGKQRMSIIRH